MDDRKTDPRKPADAKRESEKAVERRRREADALRENLAKRKAQTRAREDEAKEKP